MFVLGPLCCFMGASVFLVDPRLLFGGISIQEMTETLPTRLGRMRIDRDQSVGSVQKLALLGSIAWWTCMRLEPELAQVRAYIHPPLSLLLSFARGKIRAGQKASIFDEMRLI